MYEAFRLCDPQARAKPSDARRSDIRTRLKDATAEELILMLEWARLAPDYASQREGGYLRWITLLGRNSKSVIEDRISAAKRWEQAGKPKHKASDGGATILRDARFGRNWSHLDDTPLTADEF